MGLASPAKGPMRHHSLSPPPEQDSSDSEVEIGPEYTYEDCRSGHGAPRPPARAGTSPVFFRCSLKSEALNPRLVQLGGLACFEVDSSASAMKKA
jgi:hypothetical protein